MHLSWERGQVGLEIFPFLLSGRQVHEGVYAQVLKGKKVPYSL